MYTSERYYAPSWRVKASRAALDGGGGLALRTSSRGVHADRQVGCQADQAGVDSAWPVNAGYGQRDQDRQASQHSSQDRPASDFAPAESQEECGRHLDEQFHFQLRQAPQRDPR